MRERERDVKFRAVSVHVAGVCVCVFECVHVYKCVCHLYECMCGMPMNSCCPAADHKQNTVCSLLSSEQSLACGGGTRKIHKHFRTRPLVAYCTPEFPSTAKS